MTFLAIFFALLAVDLAAFFTLRVNLLYVDFLAISFLFNVWIF
jgi:hypothetical protein